VNTFGSVLDQPVRGVAGGLDECLRPGEQVHTSDWVGGVSGPQGCCLNLHCTINGALTSWQGFEPITAPTLPLHY